MAVLTLYSAPPFFSSAYKPMEVKFTSMRSPINTMAGESGIPIAEVKLADATDVALYGSPLAVGDLFIRHASVSTGTWPVGQAVRVSATNILSYNEVWHVLKVVSSTITVIDAPDYGYSNGGTISKHYERYTLYADITMQGTTETKRYKLLPDPDGYFTLNPQDFAKRTFHDVFDIAENTGSWSLIEADRYITQRWAGIVSEAYMVPDGSGLNIFTEFGKGGQTLNITERIVVNSVQPYHLIDAGTGEPTYLWEDDLQPYEVVLGPVERRHFLTHRPRGGTTGYGQAGYDPRDSQRLGQGDACWLAFLWGQTDETRLFMRVISYGDDGNQDQLDDVQLTLSTDSYLMNVGPTALGAYLAATTHHYRVSIVNNVGYDVVNPVWITIDTRCDTGTRFYFLNGMGAIDQYTLDGREKKAVEVRRETVSKDHMVTRLTVAGDYQRRTIGTRITRKYSGVTRTEAKATVRYLLDELIESPDVRLQVYNGEVAAYTRAILLTNDAEVGVRSGRVELEWTLGVDNRKQIR